MTVHLCMTELALVLFNNFAILAKAPLFNTNCFRQICLHLSTQQQTLMYSARFSTKMLVAKLAQMGNFCLAKLGVMWPVAQIATSSASHA